MNYNCKVELWGMSDFKNELGENDRQDAKIKDMWIDIVPRLGYTRGVKETDIDNVELTQLIKCRVLEIKEPKINMFFKDANGVKYEFISFIPNYKYRDILEINTRVIYE